MTTTSAEVDDYLALAFFGLDDEARLALASFDATWQAALGEVLADEDSDPVIGEFASALAGLVAKLGDRSWQQTWLRAWHALYGQGFSLAETLLFISRVVESCESRLAAELTELGGSPPERLALLLRAVFVAINSAIEFEEEAQLAEFEVPGELAALHCLREEAEQGVPLAVLSLALSQRSNFGHHLAASDLQSLRGILAERLRQLLRPQDKIFAGREDEWLLVLPGVHSMAQPTLAATHIQRNFSSPVSLLSGRSLLLDARIGAAMMPMHGEDGETILQAARLARWNLASARDAFGWFDPAMRHDWQRRSAMAEELHGALLYETLTLYLQPQVDAVSGDCTGAELLLRWQRENGEWVPPPLVIEMIEENGWRQLFTDWLIRFSLHTATELSAAGIDIPLSINLTAADLLDSDLPEMLAQRLETWQLPASRFAIELTESAMLSDPGRCLEVMRRLRAYGFRLALDDFGTGYSSLSYLVNLPVDELKIDRSFIVAMSTSDQHLRVVRTIIDLAWDLEMMPLAEGVENQEQVELLHRLGCNCMQGFLYAQALPLGEFLAWYRGRASGVG